MNFNKVLKTCGLRYIYLTFVFTLTYGCLWLDTTKLCFHVCRCTFFLLLVCALSSAHYRLHSCSTLILLCAIYKRSSLLFGSAVCSNGIYLTLSSLTLSLTLPLSFSLFLPPLSFRYNYIIYVYIHSQFVKIAEWSVNVVLTISRVVTHCDTCVTMRYYRGKRTS